MTDEEAAVEPQEDIESEEQAEEPSEEEQAMAELKEALKVEKEDLGALRLRLTITVPRDTLEERSDKQFAELKREATVPGFRKGHAPLELVQKRFASDVGEQLASEVIGQGYTAAVEKEDLKPLGDPLFVVKAKEKRTVDGKTETVEQDKLVGFEQALDHLKMPKEGDMTFSCEIEVKPEFEVPELEKIPVERPAITVDDGDVEEELRRMLMWRGTYKPVEDGPVELDDMLYVDLKMSVDGEVINSQENFDLPARDVPVLGIQVTGLGDGLVGKKVGEQATCTADIPDDYDNVDIRGKSAVFEITIQEIKRLELPPIDETFLAATGYDSEKELREAIRTELTSRIDRALKRALHEQIGQHLVENTSLEIPEGLSQRQTARSLMRQQVEMMQAGIPDAEVAKRIDEMRAGAHDQVVKDLKLFFIMEKIAEERNITVPEERLNAAIAMIAQRSNKRFDRVRDELSKGDGLATLYLQLRDEQILDALLEDAEVTEVPPPKKKKKSAKKKATKKKSAKPSASEEDQEKKSPRKKAVKKKAAKKST
ncbi:MAG: trigger factor [Phycisphaerales bacterium]|nr:MAG: trigger factor [Phycisphaerales bacterium]